MDQFEVKKRKKKDEPSREKSFKDFEQGGKSNIFSSDEVHPLFGEEDDNLSAFKSYYTKEERATRKKYRKVNQDEEEVKEYRARNPQPNYSNFKRPQYVDMSGREYKLATGDLVEQYINTGRISHPEFEQPPLSGESSWGTQLFWIRIPIYLRGNVEFPQAEGGVVTLYHEQSQVLCTGITDGVYYGQRRKTGYIVLSKFTSHGQVADPSLYAHLIDEDKKIKRKRTLF